MDGLIWTLLLFVVAFIFFVLSEKKNEKKKQRQEEERNYLNDKRWLALTKLLKQSPADPDLRRKTFDFVRQEKRYSADAYEIALKLVEKDHQKSIKIFALEIGRLHYGGKRPEGLPTVYDESAIENDIKARC